ncbi:hypothetical protein [Brucella cytisi]|uniref:Uncharacterized protein n=1 Tax=Brucella cytisi TaxID=407152 RepID=A0A1J6HG95_9HYPH|nr:hypothetical protein [Brucella cytisi]OIS91948.1 hypothetical protein BLA27_18715 [Brucella cytisi]
MSAATLQLAAQPIRNSGKKKLHASIQKQDEIAFIVNDTLVDTIGKENVLTVFCVGRYDESKFHFNIVLESPVYRRQERGQTELGRLRESVGLCGIEDSSELHGKEAVLRRASDGELFFTPHNVVVEAA